MDAHLDVPVALLQCDQKGTGLICMDGVQQFVHHDEDVIMLFDGQWRWVLCAQFYFDCYWCSNFC